MLIVIISKVVEIPLLLTCLKGLGGFISHAGPIPLPLHIVNFFFFLKRIVISALDWTEKFSIRW